jgi:hypothetical protein
MIKKVEGILVGFHFSFLCDLGSNPILSVTYMVIVLESISDIIPYSLRGSVDISCNFRSYS